MESISRQTETDNLKGIILKTLSELVSDIHKNDSTGLTKDQINTVANNLITRVGDTLAGGTEVRVHNLGTFSLKHSQARQGRNPRTGEAVPIAAKTSVKFKAYKSVADRVA